MINKVLAREILQMAKLDQRARNLAKNTNKADQSNLQKMKQVVRKFGWPTISLVGKRASQMAWLIVQHADTDLVFQKKCLRLMIKAAKTGEVTLQDVAYLADRVLINQGKPQVYGTQFYKDRDGQWVPRPIKNTDKLEERRKRVGLESFKIYRQKMSKF